MASRQMKKEKKKRLKQNQKEITLKNKELNKNKVEVLSSNEDKIDNLEINLNELANIDKLLDLDELLDLDIYELKGEERIENLEDMEDFKDLDREDLQSLENLKELVSINGIRGYVLTVLHDMVYELNNGLVEDGYIQQMSQLLITCAEVPNITYKSLLDSLNIKNNPRKLNSKNKINTTLNITERALLKNRMQGVLMEYWKDLKTENVDYNGIRLYFEITYQLILAGLEEKKIDSIDISVGYGDSINELTVNYSNNKSKYNINESNFIVVNFNALDNLYNTYAIYRNKYKGFSESSLHSLATAGDMEKQYESREEGKHIVSYNGIVSNYLGVFELELKKLIAHKFDLNERNLKLVDAIDYLSKLKNDLLSRTELIEDLHKVRGLRNKSAHGDSITYDQYSYIKKILLDNGTLEAISRELSYILN